MAAEVDREAAPDAHKTSREGERGPAFSLSNDVVADLVEQSPGRGITILRSGEQPSHR